MEASGFQAHQVSGRVPLDRVDAYAAALAATAVALVGLLIANEVPLSMWGAAWPLGLFAVVSVLVEHASAAARTLGLRYARLRRSPRPAYRSMAPPSLRLLTRLLR